MAAGFALHDTIQMLITIAYGIWRKRWYALATASLVSAVGWTFVYSIPYTFESTARVQINADIYIKNLTGIVARNNTQNNQRAEANIIRNRMTQRSALEKIIRRSNYLDRLTSSELETSRLIAEMKRGINIFPSGENIYTITYENNDRRLSDSQRASVVQEVVNNLVTIFVSEGGQTEDVSQSLNLLEQEIARLRDDLENQDDKVAAFTRKHYEILQGRSIDRRLEDTQQIVAETNDEIAELQASIAETSTALQEIPPTILQATSASGARGAQNPLVGRIEELKKDLDKLRINGRRDQHPDVLNVVRQISVLEKQLADEKAAEDAKKSEDKKAGKQFKSNEIPNPTYEKLFGEVLSQKSRLVALQKRLEQKTTELNKYRSLADEAPAIKNEYDRLKDGARAFESQLQELEKKREDLNLVDASTQLETLNFQVMEEPTKPLQPSGPPRLIFLTVPLIGGLVVGIGVAFILSQIKPVIITVEQLRHSFDLPVLGNVTRVLSEKDSRARITDLVAFGAVGAFLILVYLALITINMFGI